MGIYKGSQEIKHVFKGGQKLSSVYKGSQMVYPMGPNAGFSWPNEGVPGQYNMAKPAYYSTTGDYFAPTFITTRTQAVLRNSDVFTAVVNDTNNVPFFVFKREWAGTVTIKCSAIVLSTSWSVGVSAHATGDSAPWYCMASNYTTLYTTPNVWTTVYWELTITKNRVDYPWYLYPIVFSWGSGNFAFQGVRTIACWF